MKQPTNPIRRLLLLVALAAGPLLASDLFAAEREPAKVERTVVVRGAGRGYFPVALRLKDERIAVVLRGGAPHLGIKGRLDIVFSSDEGKTWTEPTVVVDGPADDRNPAFGQAADGTLVVAYWVTTRYDDAGNYNEALTDKPVHTRVTRSSDGGKTWSEPAEIDVAVVGYGSPYGKIITMPDGAMLMNVYGGPVQEPGKKIPSPDNSYLYRSDDGGETWKRFAHPGKDRFNETGLVRLKSGKILAAMRTSAPQDVYVAESADDGKTWSEPVNVTPGSVHPADLVELPDGRVLMAVGYRAGPPFGARGLVSDAAGKFDWERRFVLSDDSTNTDTGYPSSVVLKDGRVLTVWYAVGSKSDPQRGEHCAAATYAAPAASK